MKTRPISLSIVRLRKTSPQAQWKKLGMVPRIFPCVPLPAPGAPTSRIVRNFLSVFCIFVANLHRLNLDKRNHHLRRGVAALQLDVHFVRGNAADSPAHIFAAHGFDNNHQILLRLARYDTEEARKLGFEKATIKGEFSSRVVLRLGASSSFLLLSRGQGEA